MNPLVSIITPSYNSGRYLENYFQSILKQSYDCYEVIFINDGSTDNTEEIVLKYKAEFEKRNKRFIYLKQENGGQAKAMNLGFPYMKGKYFVWPDSDDEMYPDNLLEKVKYMEKHPDIALAMAGADYMDEAGRLIEHLTRKKTEEDSFFIDLLLSKNVVFCPGIYIMRVEAFFKCVPSGRINESRIGQNYQILLPVVYSQKWGYIDKTLYKYILHENSHSNMMRANYEHQLDRFIKQENTLYELIEEICIKSEKQYYKMEVYKHFNKFYLRLANKFGKKTDLKKFYKNLNQIQANGIKETIYYAMGIVGIRKG